MIQMIVIDVGHDPVSGRQMKKRTVAFVRFGDDEFSLAELCVSAQRIDLSADHDRGIKPLRA